MSRIVPVLIVLILVAIIGVPGAVASKAGVQEGLAAKIIAGGLASKESSMPCAKSANCFTIPIVFCNIPSVCIPYKVPCKIPKPCVTPTPAPTSVTPEVTKTPKPIKTPAVTTPTPTAVETEVTPTVTVTATPTVTVTATPTVTQTPGAGPVSVPEFPSPVLPIAAVMGLMMLLFYRRRDE